MTHDYSFKGYLYCALMLIVSDFVNASSPVSTEKLLPPDAIQGYYSSGFISAECPSKHTSKVAVLMTAGQSNLAPTVDGIYIPKGNVLEFNPYDGKCYKQVQEGSHFSSVTSRVAQKLIDQGPYDIVLVANFSIGGTHAQAWQPGGMLFQRLETGFLLLSHLHLAPTYFMWEDGEADTNYQTAPDVFKVQVKKVFNGLRKIGYSGPIYVAQSTRCNMAPGMMAMDSISKSADQIRRAQAELVNKKEGILSGPNTDPIQGNGRDWIQCHFSPGGADLAAQLWVESMLGKPLKEYQGKIQIDNDNGTAWIQQALWHTIATMEFHPWLSSQGSEGSDAVLARRWITFKNGGQLEENIVMYDYPRLLLETHSTHVDMPDLPLRRLWTRIELKSDGEKKSILEWTLYYDPIQAVDPSIVADKVKAFVNAGIVGLKNALSKSP